MKLGKRDFCPIHHSLFCCGRQAKKKRKKSMRKTRWDTRENALKGVTVVAPGVTRITDPTNPRGFRERRSPAAMRRLLIQKVQEQNGYCPPPEKGGCGLKLEDMGDVVPDHISPRGKFGADRDDHPDNIQAMHSDCNQRKGSIRL